jgi:hypothetical protein
MRRDKKRRKEKKEKEFQARAETLLEKPCLPCPACLGGSTDACNHALLSVDAHVFESL